MIVQCCVDFVFVNAQNSSYVRWNCAEKQTGVNTSHLTAVALHYNVWYGTSLLINVYVLSVDPKLKGKLMSCLWSHLNVNATNARRENGKWKM